MPLNTNVELWREAREICRRKGLSLSERIGTTHTVISTFAMEVGRAAARNGVSRLWIERHGKRAARVVSAVLDRHVALEDLFPGWDRAEERPLTPTERGELRMAIESRSQTLTARQIGLLQRTLGFHSQPRSLARVAHGMGLTRERARQIETTALRKIGICLPRGLHRTELGRRRRARLVWRILMNETWTEFREHLVWAPPGHLGDPVRAPALLVPVP
jgi:hypothetical protein